MCSSVAPWPTITFSPESRGKSDRAPRNETESQDSFPTETSPGLPTPACCRFLSSPPSADYLCLVLLRHTKTHPPPFSSSASSSCCGSHCVLLSCSVVSPQGEQLSTEEFKSRCGQTAVWSSIAGRERDLTCPPSSSSSSLLLSEPCTCSDSSAR